MEVSINYWAVLVAAISAMALGAVWYSPLMFGNVWIKLMGWDKKHMEVAKKTANKSYAVNFVLVLLNAYVLAHFVNFMGELFGGEGLALGFSVGFWIWLGFIMPLGAGAVLWEGKPVKLFLINVGYNLVSIILMASIIASL